MFFGIAYGLGNLFNDIRGKTSACAQDGPPDVPKTDRVRGARLGSVYSIGLTGRVSNADRL